MEAVERRDADDDRPLGEEVGGESTPWGGGGREVVGGGGEVGGGGGTNTGVRDLLSGQCALTQKLARSAPE